MSLRTAAISFAFILLPAGVSLAEEPAYRRHPAFQAGEFVSTAMTQEDVNRAIAQKKAIEQQEQAQATAAKRANEHGGVILPDPYVVKPGDNHYPTAAEMRELQLRAQTDRHLRDALQDNRSLHGGNLFVSEILKSAAQKKTFEDHLNAGRIKMINAARIAPVPGSPS
jgi:hypothetical protein